MIYYSSNRALSSYCKFLLTFSYSVTCFELSSDYSASGIGIPGRHAELVWFYIVCTIFFVSVLWVLFLVLPYQFANIFTAFATSRIHIFLGRCNPNICAINRNIREAIVYLGMILAISTLFSS